MNNYNLDFPLITLSGKGDACVYWTARQAVEGVQIFGGIGSGKTSGSGNMIAKKYIAAGYGGLVLTAKPSEKLLWEQYCAEAGRSDDLIIVEPGRRNYFNFLDYEGKGQNLTENLVQVLKTVIRASNENTRGSGDDPFWETALDMLIFNVIDLCKLAYGTVSIQEMYDIVQNLPKPEEIPSNDGKQNSYEKAFALAQKNVIAKVKEWEATVAEGELLLIRNSHDYEQTLCDKVHDARILKYIDHFINHTYMKLSEKTRSIVDFSFSGFLFRLLREPVYSLFCRHASTFTPEDCLKGKIIVINLPVKTFYKVGHDSQIMFKYIWQRAMERIPATNDRPIVFLWADESQNFLHELDVECQATARECRVATVYISQNLPNYLANMGGASAEHRVNSLLGTLATKIFHANSDVQTNRYASELIGDSDFEETSTTRSFADRFSMSRTNSHRISRTVRPESFAHLKMGSVKNDYLVEGILHYQSAPDNRSGNFIKVQFKQNSINNN